jgi:hypothetical protein
VVLQAPYLTVVELESEAEQPWVPQWGMSLNAMQTLKSGTPTRTPALWATPPLRG